MTCKNLVDELENLDFEEFMKMKENWLKTLKFVWLISGHLNEESAKKIVDGTMSELKFEECNEALIPPQRSLKFEPNTVCTVEQMNRNPNSKNCMGLIMFQSHHIDDLESSAKLAIMAQMFETLINKRLRQQEKLGYVVRSGKNTVSNSRGWFIAVQTDKADPDYILHRINAILEDARKNWPHSDEDFEKIRVSRRDKQLEPFKSLGEELNYHWKAI